MSLSPYLKPGSLNGVLSSTNKVGNYLYPDGLDKRTTSLRQTANVVDVVKDVANSITNAIGGRSPMYIIGEIYTGYSVGDKLKDWLPETEDLVRAVSRANYGVKQEGVIIDGLGDMNGTMSVEFTSNPTYFMNSTTTDQRYRKPTTLRMTVMVSNYLTDNIAGDVLNGVSALDPTGLLSNVSNVLLRGGNTRAQTALYKLRWLMENGEPFSVYTPHGIYENMLIKSIKPTTDASKMDMLYCDIEFQEMLFYVPYTENPGLIPARKAIIKPAAWGGKQAEAK